MKTLSCGPAGMQRPEQWLGCEWVSSGWIRWPLSWKLAFSVAKLIRQGNCYPWHTWENMLMLKKSWGLLTVEPKQRPLQLLHPRKTQITKAGVR